MEFIIENPENKHLIILVHGLNGGRETWIGASNRLLENFQNEEFIKENFNVAIYSYGTKIFKINWISKILSLILGFISNKPKEKIRKEFNIGIDSISRPLTSQINLIEKDYKTISFIAHSMGGLITKSTLTWLEDDVRKKINLFISLSVPHLGSQLANLGSKILGNNPQIIDLKSFGKFVTTLNRRYAELKIRPKIVYQYGNQDSVVPELSAAPELVPFKYIEATSDNHFSVVKINDKNTNFLFRRIIKELRIAISEFIGIDIGIPKGTPFKIFIESLLLSEKFEGITVEFANFNEEELNSKLREGNLDADNFTDFLIRLRNFSINNMPQYSVIKEKSTMNFKIKAIKNE